MPTKCSEYRPISLVHDLYKIVGKLLSNRLRQVMPSIISANQTAFISGRQILDGFMMENGVVHSVKKSGQHGFVMKVDFLKAFE